jgi:nucleotide-binding universal stress UspA family protein
MIPEIKNILYATDLSKNSSYAFLYAVDMAKKHNAKIVLLHSINPVRYLYSEEMSNRILEILEKGKKAEQEMDLQEIKEHLQKFCEKAEGQIGYPCVDLVSKILVPLGHPVEEILNAAEKEGCDAIVLGTHGKGFLKHTFLGSVAEAVLARTLRPVLVIPLPSEKADFDWDNV